MGLTHSCILDVSWELSQPIAPPGRYPLKYKCRQLNSGTDYLNNVIKLYSLQQSYQLWPIPFQTLCNFTLFAVYNKASLHTGLECSFHGWKQSSICVHNKNINAYMYTYIHIPVHTYIYTYTYIRINKCIYIYIHINIYIHKQKTHKCIYIHTLNLMYWFMGAKLLIIKMYKKHPTIYMYLHV